MTEALFITFSYLLGSIPFALLLGMTRGIDIRRKGSGNVGATNLGRALGRRWGVTAFLLDFTKGLVPVLTANYWAGLEINWIIASAAAAIFGHIFPIYLKFRGGKGVATAFGAMTGLAPVASLSAGTTWLLLFQVTRAVSLASLAAAVMFPLAVWISHWRQPLGEYLALQIFALIVAAAIILRHRENIVRLLRGEEHRFVKSEPAQGSPTDSNSDRPEPERESN